MAKQLQKVPTTEDQFIAQPGTIRVVMTGWRDGSIWGSSMEVPDHMPEAAIHQGLDALMDSFLRQLGGDDGAA